uniref:Advillin n=1 Tax=Astyanax mexicanus TaxID=7994 RepID=A0A8B9JMM6_ASTMX
MKNTSKTSPKQQLYRREKFISGNFEEFLLLVLVPEKSYGNFYEGDCYVLLCTKKVGGSLSYDIHYWIGSESSQDEQGAAAVYTIQLDDFLGSAPVQHREVQHHESSSFCGYFKQGIIYKKGGVASGMRHVETNSSDVQRLLRGNKIWNSFNLGDVFLLDIGKTIIQWNGPDSNRQERMKGMLLAKDIRDRERGGRAEIGVIEGDAEKNSPLLMEALTSIIGERPAKLPSGTSDDQADQHVSDADGEMKVMEVATRPLVQDLLNHDDCYILDQGGVKLFVWKGKRANKAERQAAMSRALEFIKLKGYPHTTNVETVNDGAESALFKQLFQSWTVQNQTKGLGHTHTVGRVGKWVTRSRTGGWIWRIENLELAEVDPKTYGYFYGGDCYIILYTYEVNRKKSYILYIWQGRHATQDELAASAFQAVTVDQQYGGEPVQVRVTMGKEPRHFMAMFKGKLVIFEGGTSRKGGSDPEPLVRLFQISGTDSTNTKAIEVPAQAASLNSNDVFLLKNQGTMYLWYGKGSSGDERAMAKEVSTVLGRGSFSAEIMAEGQEPAEFWNLLGGKAPYANDKRLQQVVQDHQPRLFECSNKTGRFIVTEVTDFTQDDLIEDDVMLLDTWDQVFLWIGNEANEVERKESVVTCQEYLRTHPGARDCDTPILLVKQGFEPPTFTGWFTAWDPTKWSDGKTYEQLKEELGEVTSLEIVTEMKVNQVSEENKTYQLFPFEDLINKNADELPKGVNPSEREKHLSDEDFQFIFGMSKNEFSSLPQWKQLNIKKKNKMF